MSISWITPTVAYEVVWWQLTESQFHPSRLPFPVRVTGIGDVHRRWLFIADVSSAADVLC
jgi:hypothetical protein